MADDILVTDAQGTLSSGSGANYALNADDAIGSIMALTISPPENKMHSNFILTAVDATTLGPTNAVGFSASQNGAYSSDGTFTKGVFSNPFVVYVKRLTNAATKLVGTYNGFVDVTASSVVGAAASTSVGAGDVDEVAPVSGLGESTSAGVGNVAIAGAALPASGVAQSTSAGVGDVTIGVIPSVTGAAASTSAGIGDVDEVERVSGTAASTSVGTGNVTPVSSGQDLSLPRYFRSDEVLGTSQTSSSDSRIATDSSMAPSTEQKVQMQVYKGVSSWTQIGSGWTDLSVRWTPGSASQTEYVSTSDFDVDYAFPGASLAAGDKIRIAIRVMTADNPTGTTVNFDSEVIDAGSAVTLNSDTWHIKGKHTLILYGYEEEGEWSVSGHACKIFYGDSSYNFRIEAS